MGSGAAPGPPVTAGGRDARGLLGPWADAVAPIEEPLFLVDDDGVRLRLHPDCSRCETEIYLE